MSMLVVETPPKVPHPVDFERLEGNIDRLGPPLPQWQSRLRMPSMLAMGSHMVGNVIDASRFEAHELEGSDDIRRARVLGEVTFVQLGKLAPEGMDIRTGLPVNDPAFEAGNKHYFGTFDHTQPVPVRHDGHTDPDSLPLPFQLQAGGSLLWGSDIDIEGTRMPLAQLPDNSRSFLKEIKPGTVAEIGGLARRLDKVGSQVVTMALFVEMVRFALDHDVQYFSAGFEPKALPRYLRLFGDAIRPLGDNSVEQGTVVFPGVHGRQVPLTIDLHEAFVNNKMTKHGGSLEALTRSAVRFFWARQLPEIKRLSRS